MERPILYTLRTCPTCDKPRRDLQAAGVDFEERLIDDNSAWYAEAAALSVTVPILVRGERIEVGWKGEYG